jgi:hypothetical protein
MFDIQNYTSFLTAIFVFQLVPGAGTQLKKTLTGVKYEIF